MKKLIIVFLILIVITGCSSNRGRYSGGHYIEREDGLYEYVNDYDNYNDYPDPYENDGWY